jgi:hypothetical protein
MIHDLHCARSRFEAKRQGVHLQVRDLSSPAAVGTYCCLATGGTNTRWSVPVSFSAPSAVVLTVAAQTGGHVAAVERFTVTGVRSG